MHRQFLITFSSLSRTSRVAVATLLAGAALVGVGAAVGAPSAFGATAGINATRYGVTCRHQAGSLSFSPGLTAGGPITGNDTLKFKGTVSDCTAKRPSGGGPLTITKGTVAGTLVGSSGHSCDTILDTGGSLPFKGTLKITWTTTPKLTSGTTTVSLRSGAVGLTDPGLTSTLTFPGITTGSKVSGSFSANATDSFSYSAGKGTAMSFIGQCDTSKGVTAMTGDSGYLDLGVAPSAISISPADDVFPSTTAGVVALGTYPGGTKIDISTLASWSVTTTGVVTVGPPVETIFGPYISTPYVGPGTTTVKAVLGGVTGSLPGFYDN
jgi:hypothetical protein